MIPRPAASVVADRAADDEMPPQAEPAERRHDPRPCNGPALSATRSRAQGDPTRTHRQERATKRGVDDLLRQEIEVTIEVDDRPRLTDSSTPTGTTRAPNTNRARRGVAGRIVDRDDREAALVPGQKRRQRMVVPRRPCRPGGAAQFVAPGSIETVGAGHIHDDRCDALDVELLRRARFRDDRASTR